MMRSTLFALFLAGALLPGTRGLAADAPPPATVVLPELGVTRAQLEPEYWTTQLRAGAGELASREVIEAQNARLFELDRSMYRLDQLGDSVEGDQVREIGRAAWRGSEY